ncbi:MAG TPA: hypothetical protein VJ728_17250, partial [Candidatus Binataceae bacterium]|nr:hypothetical protein [Candidatus Binataceae bacterium]
AKDERRGAIAPTKYNIMSTSDDIHRLEAELEFHRQDLREDAAQITVKIEETKAQLSPANFIRRRPGIVLAVAFLLGAGLELALRLILSRRQLSAEQVARPAVDHVAKPVARNLLTTAGKQAVTRTIRG